MFDAIEKPPGGTLSDASHDGHDIVVVEFENLTLTLGVER